MRVNTNTQTSGNLYAAYKSTAKSSQKEIFTMNYAMNDEKRASGQYGYGGSVSESGIIEELYYQQMSAHGTNRIAQAEAIPEQLKPLGIGFIFIGGTGYGMSASQVMNGDTEDIIVRVEITLGQDNYETYDVDLSEVDPDNATAIEMFAFCQYADAYGSGVDDTFGSWHALKSFAVPVDQTLEFSSLEEAATKKINWCEALSQSTVTHIKEATGETLSAIDLLRMLKETFIKIHWLTKENIKNKDDWREMTDEQWDKLIENIDKYIDDLKEKLKRMEELRQEAIMKRVAYAPSEMKAEAASEAALAVATNGITGAEVTDSESSDLEKLSWTYDLDTEDQIILAKAKMANEFAPNNLSKANQLALSGDAEVGADEVLDRKLKEEDI